MTDVVFVHGAWVGPRSFDRFRAIFETAGFACDSPAWPSAEGPYESLRSHPDPRFASLGLDGIVEHFAARLRLLERPPLLIGHSFGGLVVQRLLDRGFGSGGIAINSAPPRGILPSAAAIRTSLPVLTTWAGWRRMLSISPEAFASGFVHNLSPLAQAQAYRDHVIPTPGRPFYEVAFAPFHRATAVCFDNPNRAPLLLISGDADRTVSASMVRGNHRAYGASPCITHIREYPGRSHWIIQEPGYDEVAADALAWALDQRCLTAPLPSYAVSFAYLSAS